MRPSQGLPGVKVDANRPPRSAARWRTAMAGTMEVEGNGTGTGSVRDRRRRTIPGRHPCSSTIDQRLKVAMAPGPDPGQGGPVARRHPAQVRLPAVLGASAAALLGACGAAAGRRRLRPRFAGSEPALGSRQLRAAPLHYRLRGSRRSTRSSATTACSTPACRGAPQATAKAGGPERPAGPGPRNERRGATAIRCAGLEDARLTPAIGQQHRRRWQFGLSPSGPRGRHSGRTPDGPGRTNRGNRQVVVPTTT